MKKAYYLTYGILSENISEVVGFIERKLNIQLTSENLYEDEELYILLKSNGNFPIIDYCSILKKYKNDYMEEVKLKKIKYLISCNITNGDEDLKKKSIEYVREEFSKYNNIIELSFDCSEW